MKFHKTILQSFVLGAALVGLTACDGFMHDDLPNCAVKPNVKTTVRFAYDYHTGDGNRFSTDVGGVTLYVFNSDGKLVAREERNNATHANALKSEDFQIDLSLEPGDYSVYAVAHGNQGGYAASLKTPGAKFRLKEPQMGEKPSDFRVNLDHNSGLVENARVMIDTIWTTLQERKLTVPMVEEPREGDPQPDDIEVTATIPLMRMTNHLKLAYYHKDYPKNTDHNNYEVWIETRKGRDCFNIMGNYFDTAKPLIYTAYASNIADDSKGNRCQWLDFGIPRFIMHETGQDRSVLCFRNKATGHVTEIDFLKLIAPGNEGFAHKGWQVQEYLDREYEYQLEIALDDDNWDHAIVSVNVLSWSKRIQNEKL